MHSSNFSKVLKGLHRSTQGVKCKSTNMVRLMPR